MQKLAWLRGSPPGAPYIGGHNFRLMSDTMQFYETSSPRRESQGARRIWTHRGKPSRMDPRPGPRSATFRLCSTEQKPQIRSPFCYIAAPVTLPNRGLPLLGD